MSNSFVETKTTSILALGLKGKDVSRPHSPFSNSANDSHSTTQKLLIAPLTYTGELAKLEEVDAVVVDQLTPAIGIKLEGIQLSEVLDNEDLLKDLAIAISTHGVAFFGKQKSVLTQAELAKLGLQLGSLSGKPTESSLHIHPTAELGENGLPIGQINNVADKSGRQISFMEERSTLSSSGTHSDISFEPVPAAYSILQMHTIPKTGGDTLFSSGYKHYDLLSPAMAAFLSTLTATHDAEVFREQAKRHNFELYTDARGNKLNSGDAFKASHPVIRTNPVTGQRALFVNKTFTKRIDQLSWDESDALLAYLFKVQHESHDAQVRYRWSTNDVAIWDNSCTNHVATWDYSNTPRQGNRVVVCGEVPYLDPNSFGRIFFSI